MDEAASVATARRTGIELSGLSPFSLAGGSEPGWLLGFAAFTPDEIAGAAPRRGPAPSQGGTVKWQMRHGGIGRLAARCRS